MYVCCVCVCVLGTRLFYLDPHTVQKFRLFSIEDKSPHYANIDWNCDADSVLSNGKHKKARAKRNKSIKKGGTNKKNSNTANNNNANKPIKDVLSEDTDDFVFV